MEDYKNKAMVVTKAPLVHGAKEVVCEFYERLMNKAFISLVIKELYAISLSLSVPLAPH